MQIINFRAVCKSLLFSIIVFVFFMPDSSFAYGGRHQGYYGGHHRHYGHRGHHRRYRNYGYRHYGYNNYRRHRYRPYKYYRRHYFNYPRRRYRNYYRSYFPSAPRYLLSDGSNNSNIYNNKGTELSNLAWSTLTQSRYVDATSLFAEEAQSNPNAGVPKLGYALATAAGGDLSRGVWAMRRAFRIDPDSLRTLQLKNNGRSMIDQIMGQYSTERKIPNADQAFMLSALHYLKQNYQAAQNSIASGQKYGDESSSFRNLQKLIAKQFSGTKKQ